MSEWIEHDGKGEPDLSVGTRVVVKFRDDHPPLPWTIGEMRENWDHSTEDDADIVAYRIGEE